MFPCKAKVIAKGIGIDEKWEIIAGINIWNKIKAW